MWKWMLLLGLLCPISATAGLNPEARPATPEETQAVLDGAKSMLKDPDSAKILFLWILPDVNESHAFCGTINAKNSYGGYTGATVFAGWLAKNDEGVLGAIVLGMDGPNGPAGEVMCRMKGFGSP